MMTIQRAFQSLWGRRARKKVAEYQEITVGVAKISYEIWGRRLLLNDGEVVGIEESII